MTDRYNGLTVVLERDIRDDDAQVIIDAIKMIKGVLDVSGNVSDIDYFVASARVGREVGEKLYNIIKELQKK